jgi:hypothetical protein
VSRLRIEEKFAVIPEWILYADISAQALRIYGVMARYADKGTGKAFPSHRAIAERGRCSIRTVQRALAELAKVGAIEITERDDQAGQHSNEYFIRVSRPIDTGGQGVLAYVHGSLDTGGQHNESHSERETPLSPTETSPREPFDEFWSIYPRRQGKGDARRAFAKALRKAKLAEVLAGVERLRDDPNLPVDEPSLIPMPATWLNQERWDDDPLPPRRAGPAPIESAATRYLRKRANQEGELGDGSNTNGRGNLGLPARAGLPGPSH